MALTTTPRTLPTNFRSTMAGLDVGTLVVAYEIAMERSQQARIQFGYGRASARWSNLAADINRHVFDRGFSISRSMISDAPGRRYIFNRIEAAA